MALQNLMTTVKKKKEKGEARTHTGVFLIDRRKHPRIRVEVPFDYSLIDNGEMNRGITADVSEGGLLVCLNERIEIGTLLKIEILFARRVELSTIMAITKVIWSDLASRKSWGEYRYGLKFLSFHRGDLDGLKMLLREIGATHGHGRARSRLPAS